MKIAKVTGTVVSTINHEFFDGTRLLVCDVEGSSGYLIAVDVVDAGVGDRVLVLDEGTGARQIFGVTRGPIRSVVVGIVDDVDVEETVDDVDVEDPVDELHESETAG